VAAQAIYAASSFEVARFRQARLELQRTVPGEPRSTMVAGVALFFDPRNGSGEPRPLRADFSVAHSALSVTSCLALLPRRESTVTVSTSTKAIARLG
jgi:hypothetical protein